MYRPIPTYLPPYPPTYLPAYIPTYLLPIYLPIPTYLPAYLCATHFVAAILARMLPSHVSARDQARIDALERELHVQQHRRRNLCRLCAVLQLRIEQLQRLVPADRVQIIVIEWSRSPKSLVNALAMSPSISFCRPALRFYEKPLQLGDRAQLLVAPHHADEVKAHIDAHGVTFDDDTHTCMSELKPRHLVCSPQIYNDVLTAVSTIGKWEKVKVKRESRFELSPVPSPHPLSLVEQLVGMAEP